MAVLGTLMPLPGIQWTDTNGDPLPGALIYFYVSGTSVPLSAYADAALTTPLANPAVADAGGFLVAYLGPFSYKVVIKNAAGVTQRTVDPVTATPPFNVDLDITGLAGETLAAGDVVYCSAGDGGRVTGRWYKADGDLAYASTTASLMGIALTAIAINDSGTIRVAGKYTYGGGLAVGSLVYADGTAGAMTTTPPANPRVIGFTESSTSLVLAHWNPIPDASLTAGGRVTIGDQSFEGVKTFGRTPLFTPMGAAGAVGRLNGGIHANTTNVGNVGTGEDNLMSFSLPALVLVNPGQALRVVCWGRTAANANNKRIRVYFGATAVVDTGNVAANNVCWRAEWYVVRTGAATQKANGWAMLTNIFISPPGTAPTETLSGAVTIKATGEATANDDIIQEAMFVETVG